MCLFRFDITQSGDSEQSRHLVDMWATQKGFTNGGSGIHTCMSLIKGYVSHGQRRGWQKPDISCPLYTLKLPMRVVSWELFSNPAQFPTSKWSRSLWNPCETKAGFPSSCFYVHFGVSHQKRVLVMLKTREKNYQNHFWLVRKKEEEDGIRSWKHVMAIYNDGIFIFPPNEQHAAVNNNTGWNEKTVTTSLP